MSKEDMADNVERRSMETKRLIVNGETALGIELGSTRIKAVLIDFKGKTISGHIAWKKSIPAYGSVTVPCGRQWKDSTVCRCRIQEPLVSVP